MGRRRLTTGDQITEYFKMDVYDRYQLDEKTRKRIYQAAYYLRKRQELQIKSQQKYQTKKQSKKNDISAESNLGTVQSEPSLRLAADTDEQQRASSVPKTVRKRRIQAINTASNPEPQN